MEELLTIEEVARHFKISKATVRRHISEGRLKAVRIPAEEVKSLFRPIGLVKRLKSDLNWFEECRKLSREIKKVHGGTLLEDSSETVRNLRAGRILAK